MNGPFSQRLGGGAISIVLCSLLAVVGDTASAASDSPVLFQDTTIAIAASDDEVIKWINVAACRLATTNAKAALDDLAPLAGIVGKAELVGLGEATHGSNEIWTEKQRIVEYLIEHLGFTGLVLETPWPIGLQLDNYVLHGNGNLRTILSEAYPWNDEELVDLFEWMRMYNRDSRHPHVLRIAGMDIGRATPEMFDRVIDLLTVSDPSLLPRVQKVYEPLREAARDSAGSSPFIPAPYASLPQEIRAAYATQAREIADLLRQHAATLVAHSSLQTFDWALETAEVISQFTLYADLRGTNPNAAFSYHEQSSAANAAWCHDHWGKSIVWAHDCHVAKNTPLLGIYPDKTMGSVLRDQFGDNYLSIGTSFGQGAYLAIKPNAPGATHEIDTIRVGAPAPNSTTAVLNQAGGELFLLDLRQAPAPVRLWLELPRPIRIGAMFTPGDPEWTAKYTTLNASLGKWFDVIVHLRRVTAGHAYSPAVR